MNVEDVIADEARTLTRCARTCCWTPWGHSGAVEFCTCHIQAVKK